MSITVATPAIAAFVQFLVSSKIIIPSVGSSFEKYPNTVEALFEDADLGKGLTGTDVGKFNGLRDAAVAEYKEVYPEVVQTETTTGTTIGEEINLDTIHFGGLSNDELNAMDKEIDHAHQLVIKAVDMGKLQLASTASSKLSSKRKEVLAKVSKEDLATDEVKAFIARTDAKLASADTLIEATCKEKEASELKTIAKEAAKEIPAESKPWSTKKKVIVGTSSVVGLGLLGWGAKKLFG